VILVEPARHSRGSIKSGMRLNEKITTNVELSIPKCQARCDNTVLDKQQRRNEMKNINYLFFVIIVMFLFSIIGCGSSKQFVGDLRNLTPESKISMCRYELIGGTDSRGFFGLLGTLTEQIKNNSDRPYYQQLCLEVYRIYVDTLKLSNAYRYSPAEELKTLQDGKPMSIEMVAKENNLFACVSAKSGLSVAQGWNKNLVLTTSWEITGPSGWKLKIETEAVSKETHGVFPDVGDPSLKPVWIDMAKVSVKQFQDKFYEMMNEARFIK